MKLPTDLIQKMQSDYVSLKYKDGIFTFINVDEETLSIFIESFLEWAYNKKLINKENRLDVSSIKEW